MATFVLVTTTVGSSLFAPLEAAASAPLAVDDTFAVQVDATRIAASPGVLANDIGSDASQLIATLVTSPVHGDLQLAADGGFSYTPDAGYSGTDSFQYFASEGGTQSNVATVEVHVDSRAPGQAIDFLATTGHAYGDHFDVSASATSGLPVTVMSLSPSTCTVAGMSVTAVGVGACRLRAEQPGDSAYDPAPAVSIIVAISPRTATVVPANQTRTYGRANGRITSTYANLASGETASTAGIRGTPRCAAPATSSSPVGHYLISCDVSPLHATHYAFSAADGDLAVTPKLLRVAPARTARSYGDTFPSVALKYTGFALGQTLATSGVTGTPACASTATATSPPRNYLLTCTTGTLTAANYTFSFASSVLTVKKRELTVAADDQHRVFGTANPPLTATMTNFAPGESATHSDVTGTPVCTTTATPSSAAGDYPITCKRGSLKSAADYTFVFRAGTLHVGPQCTINWSGGGTPSRWSDAHNWDLARIPGASDRVCIPATAGSVTIDPANSSVLAIHSDAPIVVPGQLAITDPTTTSSFRTLTVTGGDIVGTGTLTVNHALVWSSGQFEGITLELLPGATSTLSCRTCRLVGTKVYNAGILTVGNTFADSTLTLSNGALFDNTGAIVMQNSATISGGSIADTIMMEHGSTTTLASTANVSISSATTSFASGSMLAMAGTQLHLVGKTFNFASPTLQGSGLIAASGATVNGTIALPSSYTLTMQTFTTFTGTVTGTGSVTASDSDLYTNDVQTPIVHLLGNVHFHTNGATTTTIHPGTTVSFELPSATSSTRWQVPSSVTNEGTMSFDGGDPALSIQWNIEPACGATITNIGTITVKAPGALQVEGTSGCPGSGLAPPTWTDTGTITLQTPNRFIAFNTMTASFSSSSTESFNAGRFDFVGGPYTFDHPQLLGTGSITARGASLAGSLTIPAPYSLSASSFSTVRGVLDGDGPLSFDNTEVRVNELRNPLVKVRGVTMFETEGTATNVTIEPGTKMLFVHDTPLSSTRWQLPSSVTNLGTIEFGSATDWLVTPLCAVAIVNKGAITIDAGSSIEIEGIDGCYSSHFPLPSFAQLSGSTMTLSGAMTTFFGVDVQFDRTTVSTIANGPYPRINVVSCADVHVTNSVFDATSLSVAAGTSCGPSDVQVSGNTFDGSTDALRTQDLDARVSSNTFDHSPNPMVFVRHPDLSDVVLTGTTSNSCIGTDTERALYISQSAVLHDWDVSDTGCVMLTDSAIKAQNVAVRIWAHTTWKSTGSNFFDMGVTARLQVRGTRAQPVFFTTSSDDTVGGDTDGAAPSPPDTVTGLFNTVGIDPFTLGAGTIDIDEAVIRHAQTAVSACIGCLVSVTNTDLIETEVAVHKSTTWIGDFPVCSDLPPFAYAANDYWGSPDGPALELDVPVPNEHLQELLDLGQFWTPSLPPTLTLGSGAKINASIETCVIPTEPPIPLPMLATPVDVEAISSAPLHGDWQP